ncbi:HD domain protein [Bacteriovorax sp. BAL6_X]|uniref:HD-GYP domain-containing protein n=1 Tax=Bacteriovorax sp. BAL6_X TaxID=1201290 RepID=UPI00038595C7|nr:HD domain-containing phosphohydrolase [Bacteriovorax sp. BAL6_X]EPZ52035.1 HD domain protein [Bacteriovorax sp. BAL6_X]
MNYYPLRITTIEAESIITFDLYIYFKETYLKYQEAGSAISHEKLEKLNKQQVAKFYILEADVKKYQQYIKDLLDSKLQNIDISLEDKVKVVDGACKTAIEQSMEAPDKEENYQMTELAAAQLKKVLSSGPDALKQFFNKKTVDTNLIIEHSMNVATLATRLAIRAGCNDSEISNIATASLLHDVGITRLNSQDQELFKRTKEELSEDEQRVYGLHVKDAVSALKDKPWVTKEVLELIVNHEEVIGGSGPNRLKELSLPIMIISLVNTYDKMVTVHKMNVRDALTDLTMNQLDHYEHDVINKFKDILIDENIV